MLVLTHACARVTVTELPACVLWCWAGRHREVLGTAGGSRALGWVFLQQAPCGLSSRLVPQGLS